MMWAFSMCGIMLNEYIKNKKQMKENDLVQKWYRCPFCESETRHEFIYKSSEWNTKNEEVYNFFISCLHCDWVQNKQIQLTKKEYEQLKLVA